MYPAGNNIDQIIAAAERGDPKAAFSLGWCYYIGSGVVQDKAEAWKWYVKAAGAGVSEAKEIVHILEAEAQRGLELKALKLEATPSSGRRSAAWLVTVSVILTSIGSIAVVLHVFDGRAGIREPGATEEDNALRAVDQSPGDAKGPANLGQEEALSEDVTAVSAAAYGHGVIAPEHKTADPTAAVESRTRVNQPTDPKRAAGPPGNFKEWAEQLQKKWLEDGNDISGTNQEVRQE